MPYFNDNLTFFSNIQIQRFQIKPKSSSSQLINTKTIYSTWTDSKNALIVTSKWQYLLIR